MTPTQFKKFIDGYDKSINKQVKNLKSNLNSEIKKLEDILDVRKRAVEPTIKNYKKELLQRSAKFKETLEAFSFLKEQDPKLKIQHHNTDELHFTTTFLDSSFEFQNHREDYYDQELFVSLIKKVPFKGKEYTIHNGKYSCISPVYVEHDYDLDESIISFDKKYIKVFKDNGLLPKLKKLFLEFLKEIEIEKINTKTAPKEFLTLLNFR